MSDEYLLRERLIELVRKVHDSRDRGWNDVESLTEFNRLLPNTDIDNLCNSDISVETIVDICLGEKDTTRILTREELLELVKRFTSPGSNRFATEAESTLAVLTFNSNCKHSAGSDLIFYPQEHFDGRSNPTAEEIVEKALRGEWGQLNGIMPRSLEKKDNEHEVSQFLLPNWKMVDQAAGGLLGSGRYQTLGIACGGPWRQDVCMARPLRIEFPGALYHVISRGNERRAILRDDLDRERRLDWLRRTVEMFEWRLHAFVLLDSHDHLFVETPEANLSAGMHHYNGSYTGYFNRRHRRAGHLFQGRFKGHLVEEQGYFLEVSRYIHRTSWRQSSVRR